MSSAVRRPEPQAAGPAPAQGVRVPRLRAHLGEREDRRVALQRRADGEEDGGQAARSEHIARAAPSLARPGTGRVAGQRGARSHHVCGVPGNVAAECELANRSRGAGAGGFGAAACVTVAWTGAVGADWKLRDGSLPPGSRIPGRTSGSTPGPKAGAQCGSSARWDLRGGPPARAVPTANDSPNSARYWAAKRLRCQKPQSAAAWLTALRRRGPSMSSRRTALSAATRR